MTDFGTPNLSISTSRISALRDAHNSLLQKSQIAEFVPDLSHLNDDSFDNHPAEDIDSVIKRFFEVGDFTSCCHWIDYKYAKLRSEDGEMNPVHLANYVKELTSVSQWNRVDALLEHSGLVSKHIIFAYYYVNSLFQRSMFTNIPLAQIGQLLPSENIPVKNAFDRSGIDITIGGPSKQSPISADEKSELDQFANSLKIPSAIMLVLGQTFIYLENRAAAFQCLLEALIRDRYCTTAEELLDKYKLVPQDYESRYRNLLEKCPVGQCAHDPRTKTAKARLAYSRGDTTGALRILESIMSIHGFYMDALVLHINCLAELHDAPTLFILSHKLVNAMPSHEYAWYSVALYYYTTGNSFVAKQHIAKATKLNPGFGEGWLAFGHILALESENEQALNCYYRAARLLERHFEPLLYVATQYCRTGVRLADMFLSDAARLAPRNPVVIHEQGTLAYSKKDFAGALRLFETALRIILIDDDSDTSDSMDSDDRERFIQIIKSGGTSDPFWFALLDNLGHCCRRIGHYEDAIVYHEAALVCKPSSVSTIVSLAMCKAALGELRAATQHLHSALAYHPHDEIARKTMDEIVKLQTEHVTPSDPTESGMLNFDEIRAILESPAITGKKNSESTPVASGIATRSSCRKSRSRSGNDSPTP